MKNSNDYDNVFKTMKFKTKRLFIPVINDIFGRDYPFDTPIDVLSSECPYIRESENGTMEPHIMESDFRIRINGISYIMECSSYDDRDIQLKIVEYAFQSAIDEAETGRGRIRITMPHIAVIYLKGSKNIPERTDILFDFPEGKTMSYTAKNVFVRDMTKEYIAENRLYPYIPFYLTRYEKILSRGILPKEVLDDIEYFKNRIVQDVDSHILSHSEAVMLFEFAKVIAEHITDGNEIEERLVHKMGGVVIETEYERLEKLIRENHEQGLEQGLEQGIISVIKTCRTFGISVDNAQKQLIDCFNITPEEADRAIEKYW